MANEAVSHISQGNMHFSNKLYEILSKNVGNVLYSPLSAHAILTLVYQGAAGETAKSMETGLHLSGTEIAAEGYEILMEELNSVQEVNLHIANKVFVHHECILKGQFKEIAKKNFFAEAENIAFSPDNNAAAIIINTWVENKTNKKIKKLIDPSCLNDSTRLVLMNAIYFKGDWLHQFKRSLTKKEKFYLNETDTVDCDMMHKKREFRYGEDEELDAQILSLPYKNEQLSLMIILPRSNTGIETLEKKLVTKNLTDINKNLYEDTVILSLPKFKIETTIELNGPLRDLGMDIMFSDHAKFPNMLDSSEPLAISKVVQKAFIEVNEEGSTAAAATGGGFMLLCVPNEYVFNADHPFIFVLSYEERESGSIIPLFVGKLTKPN